jgi:hypothetical protein
MRGLVHAQRRGQAALMTASRHQSSAGHRPASPLEVDEFAAEAAESRVAL